MDLVFSPLHGPTLTLEPISQAHRTGLEKAADDPAIWRYYAEPGHGPYFEAMFSDRQKNAEAGLMLPYTVRRHADGAILGQTCFMAIDRAHRRVEIGGTWYSPAAQGGRANPECKLLMLSHAFASGALRVEFKTDERNARSRAAILKLGAVEEGALRSHMLMWDGWRRTSVYYSILDTEWPAVRARLEARLAAL
jgi:N-acetyltransferase